MPITLQLRREILVADVVGGGPSVRIWSGL